MTARYIRGVVYASVVALTLAFGASQALATPREAEQAAACPVGCRTGDCNCEVYCVEEVGGSGGICNQNVCLCFP